MIKTSQVLLCLIFGISSAFAVESPLWLRHTSISPDGSTVAFTYMGDIFTVPVNGGRATQITSNKGYDSNPIWTPDGCRIAFSSNREGADDIYIINRDGGTAKRITTHSGNETPLTFVNDSVLMFSAYPQPFGQLSVAPFLAQTYTVNVNSTSARPKQFLATAMLAASFDKNGKLLYQDKKGFENQFRKHERSSGTYDIWLYDDNKFTKLTDFNGHDINPVWSADGSSFYYLSEKDGTLNVYKRRLTDGKDIQLTSFKEHPVRHLSVSANGTLAFSWDGEIYTMKSGETPVRMEVRVVSDNFDSDVVKNIRKSGASQFAVSPSGDEVAFVIRGDVYVTSTKHKTTRRITDTSAQERCLSFSPDGKSLVYDSDRDGKWKLFISKIKDADNKMFSYATDVEEELLYSGEGPAQQPEFSPDGKYVAFLENRTELKVINVDTKKVNIALDGKYNYSYSDGDVDFQWSPNSKWFLVDYIGIGGWNNMDIALVSRDGKHVVNLTESGYSNSNPKWALDGKAIIYQTGKYGMKSQGSWGNQTDAVMMVLDGDAWDNFNLTEEEAELKEQAEKDKKEKEDKADKGDKKKDKKKKAAKKKKDTVEKETPIELSDFDLVNRRYRMRRLTSQSAFMGDTYLNKKGTKFYYVAISTQGDPGLYEVDIKKDETKLLASGVKGGFIPDKDGENLFVLSSSGISKVALSDGSKKNIEFEAFYDRKPSKEREYIYYHMLSQVKDKFYDENMHGVDWEKYGEHYKKFLPYINNNRDFAEMMSEILGELNASHTGSGTPTGFVSLPTGELGVVADATYTGDGIRIAEILRRGPLSKKSLNVTPGDIILAIDGKTIEAGKDYYPLLEGKAGRNTNLTIKSANGKERNVRVKPISIGRQSSLLYERWVEHNEHVVDSLSNGRIGYVHVQGMDGDSYQAVYDRLLGKYRNCDAVIVDTRYNGGGWLHNDLAILLSGKEYVRYEPRGRYIGSEPFSQWNKPSVMLVNESNYSDAHGSAYTYQTLGIGDIVGAPIPGTMTAVWWETQIDPNLYFGIPQVTSVGVDGKPMENKQLNPDVRIYNNPGDLISGKDAQLECAVTHLLNKVAKK